MLVRKTGDEVLVISIDFTVNTVKNEIKDKITSAE